MKTIRILTLLSRIFILFSGLALLSVSLMAFNSPQSVMDLVQVQLTNTDAVSSIRGIYGGVSLTLFFSLIYLMIKNPVQGLGFLVMLWGFYALSRIVTIYFEGDLGAFGNQWLIIESILFTVAVVLISAHSILSKHQELVYEITE